MLKYHRGLQCLLALLCLAWLAGPAAAALDAELKTPYQLRIVLLVAEHRFFTPQYQAHLERDIARRVALAMGPLAKVSVTRRHPWLAEIQARGLNAALDSQDEYSEQRTWFVLVNFVDGRYEARARFHDGPSGLGGPRGRLAVTHERGQVGAAIADLLLEDFFFTGTVIGVGKEVGVAFQGSGLEGAVGPNLKAGEVLAISKITKMGGKLQAQPMEWALLEVLGAPRDGVVQCRFWHRYQEDQLQDKGGVIGYRCLKLPTKPGKVKLQLVGEKNQPLAGWRVQVSQPGSPKVFEQATNNEGQVVFAEALPHFALVEVMSGKTVWTRFPMAFVDHRPTVCRLGARPGVEAQAPLEIRADQWLRRIYDQLGLSAERSGELQRQLARSFEAALQQARAAQAVLQEELAYLAGERVELDRLAEKNGLPRLDLKDGDLRLEELQGQEKSLGDFVQRMERIVKEAGNSEEQGLKKLIERAGLLEMEADFEQAVKLYERVLAASPEWKEVQARLAALQSGWKIKDADHEQARAYIYQTWPRLEVGELKAQLPKARAALESCIRAGDKLSPRKLLLANAIHVANLKKLLEDLRRRDTADHRAQAILVSQIAMNLRTLHTDTAAWVKGK